ncbi:HAD family hydrolase [Egbenema bharatensis]|uniref:HAD family hydrolase n=1 Tax=Egbenema bharatensis TaxID=3463334 RepID=UPI003A86E801
MLKVLVFDLDDTLFPEHQFVWGGLQAVGEWLEHRYQVADFFEIAWQLFKAGERKTIFNQTLDDLGVDHSPELIQILLKIYRHHHPKLSLHEDAKWAFDYFKTDKKIGLITNGALTIQQNKVKALEIASRFDAIVYCGAFEPECWKPSPYPYLRMMELTGHRGCEHLYVGDHPVKDFIAAKQLGWTTIRICRPDGEFTHLTADAAYEAEYQITSLYELKQIC